MKKMKNEKDECVNETQPNLNNTHKTPPLCSLHFSIPFSGSLIKEEGSVHAHSVGWALSRSGEALSEYFAKLVCGRKREIFVGLGVKK